MTRILADDILALSHIRDIDELKSRLTEAKESHQALVLRRLIFNSQICALLWAALTKRQSLKNNKTWKKVELRNVDGDVTAAISVCMAIDVIEEFQLVINNTEIEYGGWFAIGVGIQSNANLTCLRITTTMGATGTRALSEGLKNPKSALRILDFSWSTIEEEDAVYELSSGLRGNHTLHELKFMGCSLSDAKVALIVEALCSHPCLKRLDFNGNKAGPLASTAIAAFLDLNRSLDKLDVGFQTHEERLNIPLLSESLRNNNVLKTLDLSNCQLDDDDAETLGRVLCETTALQELFVARNKFSDDGVKVLAGLLSGIKGLKRLSLWGNPFDDEGARALSKGLESNFELEDVDLFRNFPCSDQIIFYTHLNRAGRKLMHASAAAPLGLWALVLERLSTFSIPNGSKITASDLTFYLLRGPALLHAR